jgi:hypothetical protein
MYQYNGTSAPADAEEAHVRAKFAYFRKAEARIDAGPAKVEYTPAPIRQRAEGPECGTNYGYQRHLTTRTIPCRACLDARAVYQRAYRARKRVAA